MMMPIKLALLALAALQQADVSEPVEPADVTLEPGVSLRVYDVSLELPLMPELVNGQTPNVSTRVDDLELSNADFGLDDYFLAEAEAYLRVDEPGLHRFEVVADDGVTLRIGGRVVVEGRPTFPHELTTGVFLDEGLHPLKLTLWEGGGDAILRLRWLGPDKARGDADFEPIPAGVLLTPADQVRPTSPGVKQVIVPEGVVRGPIRRPGNLLPLTDLHPFVELHTLRPDGFEPKVGGLARLPDGRLGVATWDADGAVYALDEATGEVTRVAAGLAEPLGLCVVGGRVFVLQKQELTELIDHDGDGMADEYRAAVADWETSGNFHEFAFGLVGRETPNGPRLYAALAVAIDPGGRTTVPQVPGRGVVVELDPDAGRSTVLASGVRTPNGVGFGPEPGTLIVNDNQGDWLPSSAMRLVPIDPEPRFLGVHMTPDHPWADLPPDPPVVWMPQGEVGNSPTQPVVLGDAWGPYAGHSLHGDVTHGGLKRVTFQEVDGVTQGAIYRFTQGLEGGTNRLLLEGGDLYVGMIGSTGNWGQRGKLWHGLQKLTPTGDLPFEIREVTAVPEGLRLTFTKPAAEAFGREAFSVDRFRYEPTGEYGGPKLDVRYGEPDAVRWDDDLAGVTLVTDQTRAGFVHHVRLLTVTAADGEEPFTGEAWYTMNRKPGEAENSLSDAERAAGWRLLFDGESADGWRGYNRADVPDQWRVVDGALTLAEAGGGDLVFDETFGDFELAIDWKISAGGNSGIFYRGVERGDGPIFLTAPEMQVLDDAAHPDARNGRDRMAGALYDLYPVPDPSPARPAGEWNTAVVRVEGGRITHTLNGVTIVDTDLDGDDFKRRLAESKFADWPHFAKADRGLIGVQDHGDRVAFRNIKLRPLD